MSKSVEKSVLLLSDFFTATTAYFLWAWMRYRMGFIGESEFIYNWPLSILISIFWLLLFGFFGQYRTWFTRSRTDEFISVLKIVTIGIVIIFLVTFDLEKDLNPLIPLSRVTILIYWGAMILWVGLARILLRTVHRKLLERGIGRRRTLIVGWGRKADALFNRVKDAPALGYEIVGFVKPEERIRNDDLKGAPVLGQLRQLRQIIQGERIQEVLIALPHRSKRYLEEAIAQCNGASVGLKIVPDLYDVLVGQVRTNQIYGLPLIEILPQLMLPWEHAVKRLFDILLSTVLLVGLLLVLLLFMVIIPLDSKGPIFYIQRRVGKDGKIYRMIKFRSMVLGAEKMTGPIWATYNDSRVTRFGRFMRRLRLDEIPQLLNVLKGDMSWVGPRPERPYFVEKFKKAIPLYSRRLRVRPGITGWAQVKGQYDQTLEHVKEKLEYDLFYLENMSLRMDLKIILNTLYVMMLRKGH
ncbi:MAG: sugar transferase [bacterium]